MLLVQDAWRRLKWTMNYLNHAIHTFNLLHKKACHNIILISDMQKMSSLIEAEWAHNWTFSYFTQKLVDI